MDLKVETVPLDSLKAYDGNAKEHTPEQLDAVEASIREFGFKNPVLAWHNEDGVPEIVAGHGRCIAAGNLGMKEVPVIFVDDLTDAQRRALALADNQTTMMTGWDEDQLRYELDVLADEMDMSSFGFDIEESMQEAEHVKLSTRYIVPPFSVLDARSGPWQERKRKWLDLGIDSGEGRDGNLTYQNFDLEKFSAASTNTSIFDPVLCEVMYSWFTNMGDTILDPFAGGSVRGITAHVMGRKYTGMDLSGKQIEANRRQAREVLEDGPKPMWLIGDSTTLPERVNERDFDFLFTCPPYADLEVYSDDEADLSNMPIERFEETYRDILAKAAGMLAEDRFAVVVIGDARGKDGSYYGLPSMTIDAMRDAGLSYYNEIILLTAIGTAPVRAPHQFEASRKTAKVHQNVLVFAKGSPKKAARRLAEEIAESFEDRQLESVHRNVLVFAKGDPKKATERLTDVIVQDIMNGSSYAGMEVPE